MAAIIIIIVLTVGLCLFVILKKDKNQIFKKLTNPKRGTNRKREIGIILTIISGVVLTFLLFAILILSNRHQTLQESDTGGFFTALIFSTIGLIVGIILLTSKNNKI